HIGRARALATDEGFRNRRHEVLKIPAGLTSLGACLNAAANLMEIANLETASITEQVNTRELDDLDATYGSDRAAKASRTYRAAHKSLAESQKQRAKRRVIDVVDRCLGDLLSVYRDTILVQTGAHGELINEELRPGIEELARMSTPEGNLRRIDAVFEAREQMMEFNTTPLLALESLMVSARIP
ncbi:MAG: DNA polymerase III subunit delta' C-terminal domain-containing protein, partial [Nocardioidaceae bacterium]